MNKTIKEATTEEIKNAYNSKVPLLIWNYRQASVITNIDSVSSYGEVFTSKICTFNLKMATKYNLGFEFRIWKSCKDRKERLKKRILRLIETGKAQFLTLTFSPSFFERETSADTRKRYIRRFLKEQCSDYVANIDFGEDNDREHYHAVVVPRSFKIDYKPYCDFFDNSRIYAEDIRVSDNKNRDNLARYLNKLTNHALKDNGHYQRFIYSRGC